QGLGERRIRGSGLPVCKGKSGGRVLHRVSLQAHTGEKCRNSRPSYHSAPTPVDVTPPKGDLIMEPLTMIPTLDRRMFLWSACSALPVLWAGHANAQVPATGTTHSSLSAFDKLMTDFVAANRVPGAALAITRHGRLIYARAFGYADVEKKVP